MFLLIISLKTIKIGDKKGSVPGLLCLESEIDLSNNKCESLIHSGKLSTSIDNIINYKNSFQHLEERKKENGGKEPN